jgi:biopolymer transport protein ExbB/TolQ
VVTAGLQEFRNYGSGGAITSEQIESSQRALERSEAIVHAKLKRGLGGLATIGSTAPFIGLFGTVVGILHAFQQIATQKTSGIGAVAGGISEALVTTAFGLLVAIPAVMTFNYFTGKVELQTASAVLGENHRADRVALGRPGSRSSATEMIRSFPLLHA